MQTTKSSNFDLVEGPWKNFTIRRIEPTDYPKVLEHIRKYFVKEEPTCTLIGYSETFSNELLTAIKDILSQNLSFLAEETSSKELAAVRVIARQREESPQNDEEMNWRTRIFFQDTDISAEEKKSIFKNCGVKEYADFFLVATHPKFRNQGLSKELYKRALIFVKAEGFKLIKCIFTTPLTRKVGTRLGFVEYRKIDYKLLKDSSGKSIFPSGTLSDEHFAIVSLKPL